MRRAAARHSPAHAKLVDAAHPRRGFPACQPSPAAALAPPRLPTTPPTRPPAALVPHRPAFFVDQALPFLLPLCTDPVLEARHGAVAALAELLPALRWAVDWAELGG